MKITALACLLGLTALSAACGGNTETGTGGTGGGGGGDLAPCGDHPLDCPDGETCSFVKGDQFACLPSGTGVLDEVCSPLVGQATCADDLICVKKAGAMEGTCTQLCDPSQGDQCGDLFCVPIETASGAQTRVCLP